MDRIVTRQKLVELKIEVPNTMCAICGEVEESSRHVFFECDMATWIWSRIGLWCNAVIPLFDSVNDVTDWVDQNFKDHHRGKIVKVIASAMLKSIWNCRNDIIFNSRRIGKEECLRRLQELSFHWMYNRSRLKNLDLNVWKSNPFCNS